MQNLSITFIQTSLSFEDVTANLAMFEEKIWQIKTKTDVIVLPEMFNSGFTMNAKKIAEPMNGRTMKWMKQLAAQTNAAICGSLAINDKGNFYNRLIWMLPEGNFYHYDKIHTFTYAGESDIYSKGADRLIIDYKGWKICPLVCYDLRFPEISMNTTSNIEQLTTNNQQPITNNQQPNYDLLIYVANWPKTRMYAWNNLLKARAIENSAYVVGVNILGIDGNRLEYSGNSQVCNPVETLLEAHEEEGIFTIELQYDWLQMYRTKFPFLNDRN